jgi:DNA-binding PadR family transcriptional regulator
MLYEFIVLAQLMHGPAHGYLIAKIINDMIGPYARISYGRLYPLLAKLEQNGLIEAVRESKGEQEVQHHDRNLRIFKITDDGRVRFLLLMSDTSSNPGDYAKLFSHKVTAFAFIAPTERLRLINHYITYCQAHVFHLQAEAVDLVRKMTEMDELYRVSPQMAQGFPRLGNESLECAVSVMQHTIDQWEHEIEWARRLRQKEEALVERAGNAPNFMTERTVAGNQS